MTESTKLTNKIDRIDKLFTTEGTTTVGTPAAVGIDDDFTTGQTGVAHGTADNKVTTGIDVVFGVLIDVLFGNDCLDDLF